jgi:two-component system NarL family sensor kinase
MLLVQMVVSTMSFSQSSKTTDSLKTIITQVHDPILKVKNYLKLADLLSKNDINATKHYLDSANNLGKSKMNDSLRMLLNKNYAEYYNDIGKPDSTIIYANTAISLATKLTNKSIKAVALNLKGNAFLAKRDFKNSQAAYLDAIQLYISLNNEFAVGNLYVNLGYLFQQQHMVKEAESEYAEAGIIFKKLNNKATLAQLYNNYGILYGESNQFVKSAQYFEASMRIREKLNDPMALANAYLNVGGINVLLKNYSKAETNLLNAKTQFQKINNVQGVTSCLTNLGELYEQKKDYPRAIFYSKEAVKQARINHNNEDLENALVNLSTIYTKTGDYKTAYEYKDNLNSLKDTIYQKSLTNQIAEMQTKFETNQKEQKIRLLKEENVIQKLSISRKNRSLFILVLSFLASVLLGVLFYGRYKHKQEAILQGEVLKQQDIASKRIIEAEEAERKRIAGDLHDGIGQLFSTVKMNLETLIDRYITTAPDAIVLAEKTMAMVDESCTEVRSIAHQLMPNALIKSGLVSALRDFVNKIPSDRLKVTVETKGINEHLDTSIETVLYRVIQESVNNVIKHANATTLDILLLSDAKEITVTIEDNGKGFDKNDQSQFKGIGLKNITSRVKYLKGTVEISSSPGKGTLVAIYVPLA